MSRSFWKSDFNLCNNFDFELSKRKKIPAISYDRASTVLPFIVGRILHLHSGKKLIPLLITEAMIGHKLGEFIPTRGTFIFKKKGKRIRKKKGQ